MKLFSLLWFTFVTVMHAAAAPDPSTLNELSNMELGLKEAFQKEVGAAYEERMQKLAASYREALKKNLNTAAAAARLEEATAFQDEIGWLETNAGFAPRVEAAPPSVTRLRSVYGDQLADLKEVRIKAFSELFTRFEAELTECQDRLTKNLKLEDALAVKQYRETARQKLMTEWFSGGSAAPVQVVAASGNTVGVDIVKRETVVEGETLKDRALLTGGITTIQTNPYYKWSGGSQLLWRNGKVGDKLTVNLRTSTTGKYDIILKMTSESDFGFFKIQPGQERPKEINLGVTPSAPVYLEWKNVEMTVDTPFPIVVELIGVEKGPNFGLDCITLVR